MIKAVVAAVRLNDGVHHAPPAAAAAADNFSTLLLQRSTSTSKAIAGEARRRPRRGLPRKPSVSYSTAPEGDAAGGDGADGGVPFGAVVHFTNHFAEPSRRVAVEGRARPRRRRARGLRSRRAAS